MHEPIGRLATSPDHLAWSRMVSTHPVWFDIQTAGNALSLRPFQVIHAGPPLRDPRQPAAPLRSSIVLACLHEGWCRDENEAEALIDNTAVELIPAQSRGCVMPLAAVATINTALVGVSNASGMQSPSWSLLGSGPAPEIRFGGRDPGCLAAMRYRDGELAALLRSVLSGPDGPIDLLTIARDGLARGDELHARTSAATEALCMEIDRRLSARHITNEIRTQIGSLLAATPGFFLTLWMAACRLSLSAAEGVSNSALVTRIGANGQEIGFTTSSKPNKWLTAPATPPSGSRFNNVPPDCSVCGVIGDSAVIDAMGFGGQMTANAPEVLASLAGVLPTDHRERSNRLMADSDPRFDVRHEVRCGLGIERIVDSSCPPLVNIGMLAADGRRGLVGKGQYAPPLALFKQFRRT